MEDLFQKGIDYFNNGYFFEAHDTFEELWMDDRDERKLFYQGLVQLSTGFYHLVMKNLKGAESQLTKGVQKLSSYPSIYCEINLKRLLSQVDACIEQIRKSQNGFHDDLLGRIPNMHIEKSSNMER